MKRMLSNLDEVAQVSWYKPEIVFPNCMHMVIMEEVASDTDFAGFVGPQAVVQAEEGYLSSGLCRMLIVCERSQGQEPLEGVYF
jgi:hypothetical protein